MTKPVLLLVDDESNILTSLRRVFEDDGYDILTATSGKDGLEIMKRTPAQVIISDQRMPIMTGAVLLEQIKNDYPDTIRIILSGYSDFESLKSAINAGAIYKFFNKPWDDDLLREGVREAFKLYDQNKKNARHLTRLTHATSKIGINVSDISNNDMIMADELNTALEQEQFFILYQPIVNLESEKVSCVEALLYWQHPDKGIVGPDAFITTAEETGLIIPITAWVIKTACKQLAVWQKTINTFLGVAINLSAYQFFQPRLLDLLRTVIQQNQLTPGSLHLEITESMIMHNIDSTIILLQKMIELGVKISLDDFGTGFSSLSYLQHFPLNSLKIDKSFVRHVDSNTRNAEIVLTIIRLAKAFHLEVIAEGVENKKEMIFLKNNDCDYIQGYLISKPVTVDILTDLLGRDKII